MRRVAAILAVGLLNIGATDFAPYDSYYEAKKMPAEYLLTCAEFLGWIKERQPSSIEDALKIIKERRPKYLTQATFAFGSQSLHESSFESPRAIVFGGDAKTVITFNGRKGQRGFERLEMACFDDRTETFHFRDIAFPKDASPDALDDLTNTEKKQNFVISEGRGAHDCRQCHQSPGRPNWDAYPIWPGFYGAVDDSHKREMGRGILHPVYTAFETEKWKEFLAGNAQQGRYQYVSQDLERPNDQLGLFLGFLNGRRIVRELKNLGPSFERKKYQFAKALFCAPNGSIRRFESPSDEKGFGVGISLPVLPEDADNETKEIFLSASKNAAEKQDRLDFLLKQNGTAEGNPTDLKQSFPDMVAYYKELFPSQNDPQFGLSADAKEALLVRSLKKVTDKFGISIENWSMVLFGGYLHENGLGGGGKVALRLILEKPFTDQFLSEDRPLLQLLFERREREMAYSINFDKNDAERLSQLDREICGLLDARE